MLTVAEELGEVPHLNYNEFLKTVESRAKEMAVKLPVKSKNFMKDNLAAIDESAEPVIKKITRQEKQNPAHFTVYTTQP